MEALVYLIVFASIFFLFEGAYLVLFGRAVKASSRVNRRIAMLSAGMSTKDTMEKLRKEQDLHTAAKKIPIYGILAAQMQRAGMAIPPAKMILIILAAFALGFAGLTLGTGSSLAFRLGISAALAVGGVYAWVLNKARKRSDLMQELLPDSIELMVRSLRVGHPFTSAFRVAAQESPDPLGTEYGFVSDEISYGRDIGEALNDMAERLEIPDLRFLSVAVGIQQQSGGNLAEVLAGLAKVIRDRFKLFRKVKAITAEAKWSGNFLSVFPILVPFIINAIQPGYFNQVMEKSWFYVMVAVILCFLIANLVVMRRLVDIKV